MPRGCARTAIMSHERNTKWEAKRIRQIFPIHLLWVFVSRMRSTSSWPSYKQSTLCLQFRVDLAPSSETSLRALAMYSLMADDLIAQLLSSSSDLNLGCDGTSTYFDRHFFAIEMGGWKEDGTKWRALVALKEMVKGHGAPALLQHILSTIQKLNEIQQRKGLPLTRCSNFMSMVFDNTSENTGKWGGQFRSVHH